MDYFTDDIADKIVEEIGFPPDKKSRFVINPKECALIVVDMNNYFTSPESSHYLPAAKSVVSRLQDVLKKWRTLGGTVVFTRHEHTGSGDLGMFEKFFNDFIKAGTKDAEINPLLLPLKDEKIIVKNSYDAFYNTSLDEYLKTAGITQVIVTGVLTQMCVETTARSAFCRGFEVFVPVDLTCTTTYKTHLSSLKNLSTAVSVPVTAKEILNLCQIH
ncbi:MAG: cysteine hydrolase [Deltaproteobacteria bacterium]|nr:cysteine hydrolase [Deltaproteobacteria bacterium]